MQQQHESEKPKLNLNVTQVAGGAMAAVTAAVVASRFGIGGTLIGAALASVVSSAGSTLYAHMLRRTGSGVRQALDEPAIVRRLAYQGGRALSRDGRSSPPAQEANHRGVAATLPKQPQPPAPSGRSRHLPAWAVPVLATMFLFTIAMGATTGAEALTGRPAASWTGGPSPSAGTTVGTVVSSSSLSTPSPSAAPTALSSPAPAIAGPSQQPVGPPSAQPAALPSTEPRAGSSPPMQPPAGGPPAPKPQPSGGGATMPDGQ
jgi:hypothetical protein